jgi:hypothetical protein
VRTYLLMSVLFVLTSTASYARDGLVWRSEAPIGQILSGTGMTSNCYSTIRRLKGRLYYHSMECSERAYNHLDIGVPLYGPPVKMPREARKVYIRRDGQIILK